MVNTLKLPSPTKLARLGHFLPASQAGRLAGPVFFVLYMSFLWSTCAETFHLAFPERPQEKVDMLANRMANKDGKICEYGH